MTAVGDFKFVVVGSGFFGAVYAERIATVLGEPVLVVERREHVGGNSFSEVDDVTGVEYHRYGSHLFHTSNRDVWDYVNTFTAFTNYRHRVLSRFEGKTYTMPINLMTLNRFYGTDLSPLEAKEFIAKKICSENISCPANLEEKAISLIGRELYEAFVKGYTAKQWETDPKLLPAEIISRLPVRLNYNDFYFNDTYEGLPVNGYGSIFKRMLGHRRIEVLTRCDFFDIKESLRPDVTIIYTGPIDRFFGFCFGPLAWRTLDFEITRLDVDDFQGASVINYADIDVPLHAHPRIQASPPGKRDGAGKDPDHERVFALCLGKRRAVLSCQHQFRERNIHQICKVSFCGKGCYFRWSARNLQISRHAPSHRGCTEVLRTGAHAELRRCMSRRLVLLITGVAWLVVGPVFSVSAGMRHTCDILEQAGSPCIAAHSTTRALFASYKGPLYAVQRSNPTKRSKRNPCPSRQEAMQMRLRKMHSAERLFVRSRPSTTNRGTIMISSSKSGMV